MADFPRRDAKPSGAKSSLKTGSKTKDTTRLRTLTSNQTSETRAPMPSSAASSVLGSVPGDGLGGRGGPEHIEEEGALASEQADSILEDSQDSDSSRSADEVDIPAHRHAFNEADCEAAPSIVKLDHLAMLQELLVDEGWEPGFFADAGDDEGYDESLVDWTCPCPEDTARVVVRVHPAMGGLEAGEQYREVTLEEWQQSGGGSGDIEEPEHVEPPRWWSPPQFGRIRDCGVDGAGEASLLAGSPAVALRRWRDLASRDSADVPPSSAEDP